MMAVIMMIRVISVIIMRPMVPDIYIYRNGCIPSTVIKGIIAPEVGGAEVWIIPSGVISKSIAVNRVGNRIS